MSSAATTSCDKMFGNCAHVYKIVDHQADHWPAPVSKVPWVVRESSTQALRDSRFGKEILSCSDDKEKTEINLRLYSLINEAFFPLYLPGRYHSMDCNALKNMTKVEGHYWTHASHFLLTNQLHGTFFWQATAHYGSEPTLAKDLKSLPLLSRKKSSEMFKDGLEVCQTSAEFLLNPWVLMQLPSHPVLLLQWTAGVLTEFYSLRLELIELHRWHLHQKQATIVKKLFKLLKDMSSYVFQALYQVQITPFSSNNLVATFLKHVTQELMPQLEFMISGKARDVVRALKRLSFGTNFRYLKGNNNLLVINLTFEWENTYNCLFSDHFWQQATSKQVISGISRDASKAEQKTGVIKSLHGPDKFLMEATPIWIAQMETKYGKDIETGKIFGLLQPMIIKGVITGVSTIELLKGIDVFKVYFTHCYYRLMELNAIIEGGLRDEDAGVLYDVLYTRAKYRIADVQCAMFVKLALYCYEKTKHDGVQLHALNVEGPEMSFRQISETIDEAIFAKTKTKRISGWKDLKNRVPLSCRSKVNLNEPCPCLAEEGATKVAQKFEERIKRIMFNVFEDQESWTENNQIKLHPDQQFYQYVLPCFVASLLEFADNDDVELLHKENYVRIVHELIKCFEVDPYRVACMNGPFAGGISPYYLTVGPFIKNVALWQQKILVKGLQTALGSSPKAKNVAETLDRNFISVLLDHENTLDFKLDKYRIEKHLWRIQVHRLFSRILNAIKAAVPGSVPNLRALEMTLIANICFTDHLNRLLDKADATTTTDEIYKYLCLLTKALALKLLGHPDGCVVQYADPKISNGLQVSIMYEFVKLSMEQITALVMFYSVQTSAGKGTLEPCGKFRVPMDRVEEVFFAYRGGDQVKLKLLLGKMFTRYGINFSEVSYDFAKKVAPIIYLSALAKVKNGRVQMMQPCELTLLPIKHCRWCGVVRNDMLRLCEECKADRGFPFRTWFCGDECERLAMDKLHREEHVRHLLVSVGIEDVKARAELQPQPVLKKKKKKQKNKTNVPCSCKHTVDC